MALSLTRVSSGIKDGADSIGYLIECSDSGVTTGSWQVLPIMADQEYSRDTKDVSQEDDSGATVYTSSVLKQKTFKLNSLQTDKQVLDLQDYAEGKYFLLWIIRGLIGSPQKTQELAGFVKVSGKTSMQFKDVSKIALEFQGQDNQVTITVSKPDPVGSVAKATSITIPLHGQMAFAETT